MVERKLAAQLTSCLLHGMPPELSAVKLNVHMARERFEKLS